MDMGEFVVHLLDPSLEGFCHCDRCRKMNRRIDHNKNAVYCDRCELAELTHDREGREREMGENGEGREKETGENGEGREREVEKDGREKTMHGKNEVKRSSEVA